MHPGRRAKQSRRYLTPITSSLANVHGAKAEKRKEQHVPECGLARRRLTCSAAQPQPEVESKIRNQQKIIFTRPGRLGSWS